MLETLDYKWQTDLGDCYSCALRFSVGQRPRSSKPRMLALLHRLAFLSQIDNVFIKLT